MQTMDNDSEKFELRAMCEQFKKLMQQQKDVPAYDQVARVRLGQMIGRAALDGSEYAVFPAVLLWPLELVAENGQAAAGDCHPLVSTGVGLARRNPS